MAGSQTHEPPKADETDVAIATDESQDSKKTFGGPRKRLMWGRIFLGQVVDWKGKYGWIQPAEPIVHQKANLRQGRIFLSRTDLVGCRDLLPGVMVQFQVYEDDSGLGAQSCSVWNPMMPFKGGWVPGKGYGKKGKGKGKDGKESAQEAKDATGPAAGSSQAPPSGQAAAAVAPAAKAPQAKAPQAKAGKAEGEPKGKGKGGRGKDGGKKGEGGKASAGKGGKSQKGGKGKDEKGKGRGGNDRNAPGRPDRPGMPGGLGAAAPKLAGFPGRPAAGQAQSAAGTAVGLPGSAPRMPKPASPQASPQQLPMPSMGSGRGLGLPVPSFMEGSMPQNFQSLAGLQGLGGLQGLPGLQGLQQSLGLANPPWTAFMPPSQQSGSLPYPDLQDLHGLPRPGAAQPPFTAGLAASTSFLT